MELSAVEAVERVSGEALDTLAFVMCLPPRGPVETDDEFRQRMLRSLKGHRNGSK